MRFSKFALLPVVLHALGCANFSSLQTAHTTPEGTTEVVGGFGMGSVFNEDGALVATPQIIARRGFTPKFDASVGLYSIVGVALEAKYMFFSNEVFTMAAGVKAMYTYAPFMPTLVLPFFINTEVNENFTFYASPKLAFVWTRHYGEYERSSSRWNSASGTHRSLGPLYVTMGSTFGIKVPVRKTWGFFGEGTLMVGSLAMIEADAGVFFGF